MVFFPSQPATLFHSPLFDPFEYDGHIVPRQPKVATNSTPNDRPVNVTESDEAWTVCMDIPGVKLEDIEIKEHNGTFFVMAQRKTGNQVKANYRQRFSFDSSTTNLDDLTSELADGVLTITIPKKPEPEPVTVEVAANDPPEVPENADAREFRCTFDLPGVRVDDLHVVFHKNVLYLEAERKKGNFTSSVQRMVTVGQSVDVDAAKAYLKDGIFTLVAPRLTDEAKPETRRITMDETPDTENKEEE